MYTKLFWLTVAAYVALRGALFYTGYQGSRSPELRQRAEKYFSGADIDRGFEYARRGFGVRIARAVVDLALILFVVQSGLAGWLSDSTLGWAGGRWYIQAVLFTALLVLGFFVLGLPFDYYLGHVLEQRFDFSTQSAGAWFWTQAKSVSVLLVLSMAAALLWFGLLRVFPRGWVVVVPAAFTIFEAALIFLMPYVLLPLFYKSVPLPPGSFRARVVDILSRAGIHAQEIFVIDESRYSKHTNAFFTGLGPTKNIFLYDTLLKDHPEDEALTIIAHEAGHWRGGHVRKGLLLGCAGLLAGSLLLWWLYPKLAGAGGLGWRPLVDPGSLPALLLLALVVGFFASPIESAISRRFEREADRAALELTGLQGACVEAEKRLARTNRSQLLPHPLVVFWYYSHPPALERIEAAALR